MPSLDRQANIADKQYYDQFINMASIAVVVSAVFNVSGSRR